MKGIYGGYVGGESRGWREGGRDGIRGSEGGEGLKVKRREGRCAGGSRRRKVARGEKKTRVLAMGQDRGGNPTTEM